MYLKLTAIDETMHKIFMFIKGPIILSFVHVIYHAIID